MDEVIEKYIEINEDFGLPTNLIIKEIGYKSFEISNQGYACSIIVNPCPYFISAGTNVTIGLMVN